MSKSPAPVANIVALRFLIACYARLKKIPPLYEITEKKYIQTLTNALVTDEVVSKTSKNLVKKLRGYPSGDLEDAQGIDSEKLDKIAKILIRHYHFIKRFGVDDSNFPWRELERKVIGVPDHLKLLQEKKYFKFLVKEDQTAVDQFVERKLNELGIETEDLLTYAVHVWNTAANAIRIAILQINRNSLTATYTYFTYVEGRWVVKNVLRSDKPSGGFQIANNVLTIRMFEEDDRKNNMSLVLYISIRDTQYFNYKYLKAIISLPGYNSNVPVSATVLLQSVENFQTAYNILIDSNSRKSEIGLELIAKRLEIKENIVTLDDLETAPTFKVLNDVRGAYQIFAIPQVNDFETENKITKGICFIQNDGIVYAQFVKGGKTLKGYIDATIFQGRDNLRMKYFITSADDDYNFTYDLKIERNAAREVIKLKGIFSGIFKSLPITSAIIFHRHSSVVENFEQLEKIDAPAVIHMEDEDKGSNESNSCCKYLRDQQKRVRDMYQNYEDYLKRKNEKS